MAARTKVFVDIVTKSAGGKTPGAGLKKFAVAAAIASAALVVLIKFGKEWSKAASDAEEIGSKYATIFRDIGKESEALADKFAEDFGLASSSARELLGSTADLLTGFGLTQAAALDMSIATNELAADLASFSNAQGGAEAVSKALTAAYSGERESLKTYGIIINEAMVKAQLYKQAQEGLTFASERQAKIAATLALAIEQSGNAIGDVARTFNSHANVTRRLEESTKSVKEELGKMVNKGLTPMLIVTDKLVKSMAEWLNKTNELNEAIEKFEEGTADGEQTVLALNRELINQVVQMSALNDAVKIGIAGSKAAVEAQKKRIEQTQFMIGVAARSAALEAQGAALSEETAKQKAKDDEIAASRAKEVEERIKALNKAYDGTIEGQIEATEAQIAFFETFEPQGPMATAVLKDLREELEKLIETEKEAVENYREGWLTREEIIAIGVQAELELEQILAADKQKKADKEIARAQEVAAAKIAIAQELSNALSSFSALAVLGNKNEIASIDASIAAAKEKGESTEELEAKKRELLEKNWKTEKAFSLTQAFINTALAVTKSLTAAPWPFNAILAALTGAAGAAEIAVISGQAMPAFATGGQFITDGPTLIGDNASGQERVTVEPLGGGGGNNTGQIMILRVGDRDLKAVVQGWIDNRGLHSSFGGAI